VNAEGALRLLEETGEMARPFLAKAAFEREKTR